MERMTRVRQLWRTLVMVMAGVGGFEPPTAGFGDRCSAQAELHSYLGESCCVLDYPRHFTLIRLVGKEPLHELNPGAVCLEVLLFSLGGVY